MILNNQLKDLNLNNSNSINTSDYQLMTHKLAKLCELTGNFDNNLNQIAKDMNIDKLKGRPISSKTQHTFNDLKITDDIFRKTVNKIWRQQ